MHEGYDRISPNWTNTKQNLALRIGFGLVLILNATEAGSVSSSGAMGMSRGPALLRQVADVGEAGQEPANDGSDPAEAVPLPPGSLSKEDERHYAQAFAAAAKGDWAGANLELDRAGDKRLEGTVRAAIYLHSGDDKPGYDVLSDWLRRYPDLPDAGRIYRLAAASKPPNAVPPPRPPAAANDGGMADPERSAFHPPGIGTMARLRLTGGYSGMDLAKVNHLVAVVLAHLRDDAASTARHVLETSETANLLEGEDLAALRARVAAGLLYDGDTEPALKLAERSIADGDEEEATWTAGLAAYKLGDFDRARGHFKAIADSHADDVWTASAASFWAGRAAERLKDDADARQWMRRAAGFRATFYGMLAERTLGTALALDPPSTALPEETLKPIAALPAGSRALALIQVGEPARAEAELTGIDVSANPRLRQALQALAGAAHLSDLSQRLGIGLSGGVARVSDSGSYPVPRWQPHGGFDVDPALIYAIMRQESRFDPRAESDAGALGLMQVMPHTAAQLSARREHWEHALLDPRTNLDLGQRYVETLLEDSDISGNLIMMAAAYNGGLGNLSRWREGADEDDPLMFLETLPAGETRGFVEQVLTNYWIYRLRLGQDTRSLTDLAAARWPMYTPPATQVADAR